MTSYIPTNKQLPLINQFVSLIKLKNFNFNSLHVLKNKAHAIVDKLNLTVVKENYHQFQPFGITYIFVLSQSHLILHSWPEFRTLHIDLMTYSNNINNEEMEKILKNIFINDAIFYLNIQKLPNLIELSLT